MHERVCKKDFEIALKKQLKEVNSAMTDVCMCMHMCMSICMYMCACLCMCMCICI